MFKVMQGINKYYYIDYIIDNFSCEKETKQQINGIKKI